MGAHPGGLYRRSSEQIKDWPYHWRSFSLPRVLPTPESPVMEPQREAWDRRAVDRRLTLQRLCSS